MAYRPGHTCKTRRTLVLAVVFIAAWPWSAAARAYPAAWGAVSTARRLDAASGTDARPLPLGAPSEREIRGGEKHLYGIRFASRQHLRLVVRQRDADVVVSLLDAGLGELLRVDRANGTRGVETLSLIAEGDETLYLQLSALGSNTAKGGYEIRVEELRAPNELDAIGATAEQSFFAGEKLYRQRQAKTLTESLEKYEEARRLWQQAGDTLSAARALHSACKAYYYLDKYDEAIDKCAAALALERSVPSRWDEAVTLLTTALSKLALAQYEGAWADGQAALEIFQAEHDDRFRAFAAYTLGRINFLQGDVDQALDKHRQALEVRRRLGDRVGEAFSNSALGRVYFYRAGDNEQALEYYGEALRLAREVGNNNLTAQVLDDIGRLSFDAGDRQLALQNYRQALELVQNIEPRTRAETLTYIGMVYAAEGRYREALDDYYGEALKLQRGTKDAVGEGHTLHHMGAAYAAAGRPEEALAFLHQALKIWQTVLYRAAEAGTRYEIARVEVGRGNMAEACRQLELALPVVEFLRTRVANQSLRTSYFISVQKYYELYADALMRRYEQTGDKKFEALALGVSERRRARSLLDTLIESRAEVRSGISAELREVEREVQKALSAASFNGLLTDKLTPEQAARVGRDLDRLIRRYHELEARIRQQSPRYAGLRYPTPPPLEKIQSELLDNDQMLLEYALGDERSYLWAVTPGGVESYVLPGRATIESAVDKLRALLTERNRVVEGETLPQKERRFERADAELDAASAALASMLRLDKGSSLLKAERLLIVGDGALQYLPFNALLVPERAGQPAPPAAAATAQGGTRFVPLLVYHETEFPLAMSLVAEFRRGGPGGSRPPPDKTIAIIADPVFGTSDGRCCKGARGARGRRAREEAVPARTAFARDAEQASSDPAGRSAREVGLTTDGRGHIARLGLTWVEAEAIRALVPKSKLMAAFGFDARLDLLLGRGDELSRYRILHFGTHGLLNNKHPELSGILLSMIDESGAPQNGFLQMHHIYNLQLQADMVVLSSCETAIGKELRGEGLAGLSRGFIYAGARRIVASLWAVHDASTSDLMRNFYGRLKIDKRSGRIGVRPARALRLAQLEMWRQRLWHSPYYWAGFVAQGDPN